MLDIRPNCECCNVDLPNESTDARICTFECTFCVRCAEGSWRTPARTAAVSWCAGRAGGVKNWGNIPIHPAHLQTRWLPEVRSLNRTGFAPWEKSPDSWNFNASSEAAEALKSRIGHYRNSSSR